MSLQQQTLYTIMTNSITLEKVKEWENLVDVDTTGEDIQALECYFLDEDGESCWVDEAVKVCFNAYDYDNKHDFDTLRSTLSEVGVEFTDGGYETEQGDFDGDLNTSWGTTKCCYGRMYSIIIPFIK